MGLLQLQRAAMIRYLAITMVLAVVVVGGLRAIYEFALPHDYEKDESFLAMTLATEPASFTVRETPPEGDYVPGTSRLDQIVERGVLRVGFLEDSLPNVFINAKSMLVGLDIDLVNVLASEMQVDLEFVKVSVDSMVADLTAGRCDLVMSGLTITPDRMLEMRFSEPYMKATMSFIVRDHMRSKFSSREAVKSLVKPRIGVLDNPYYVEELQAFLPQAEIVVLKSPEEFFRQRSEELDAMLLTAERGAAWTLIYPEFSVAIPQPTVLAAPVAIGMARDAEPLADFINAWLRLKHEDGTVDELYQHWILGGGAQPRQPRWSVIRNVLGWVD
jgi:ABC-type amino acid transport substrate-binding protein